VVCFISFRFSDLLDKGGGWWFVSFSFCFSDLLDEGEGWWFVSFLFRFYLID